MDSNSEVILKRIRAALKPWQEDIEEKLMFGGTCFLFKGKMCVGEMKQQLLVRLPAKKMKEATQSKFVKPMDFTGRPMKEFAVVSDKGFNSEAELQQWVEIGVAHATTKLK